MNVDSTTFAWSAVSHNLVFAKVRLVAVPVTIPASAAAESVQEFSIPSLNLWAIICFPLLCVKFIDLAGMITTSVALRPLNKSRGIHPSRYLFRCC